MFNGMIRSIIDLLRIKQESKKTSLEIDKLEREKREAESVIKIATTDDIRKYDPRINEIEQKISKSAPASPAFEKQQSTGPWPLLLLVLLVIGIGYLVYRYLL